MSNDFYDQWALKQLNDKVRDSVLRWKGVNLLNLIFRNDLHQKIHSVCEIGGAEGTVLHVVSRGMELKQAVNYEISKSFCLAGQGKYPEIQFENFEFNSNSKFYDLIILSDIIEHVENDDDFLSHISKYCQYVAAKVPIEKSLFASKFYHAITFRKIPEELIYGPGHINGHLRAYNVTLANRLFFKYFEILDQELSDVSYFYPSSKKEFYKRLVSKRIFIFLYGGALFVVGKSRNSAK